MIRNAVLRHVALATGCCLLLISIGAISLVSTASPSSFPPSDTAHGQGQVLAAVSARDSSALASRPDSAAAARAVREAWQRARDAGAYGFSTDLTQFSYPARTLANSGRGPQTIDLHMEGEVDLPARTLGFRMWQPDASGSGSASDGGVDGRVEGERVYVRGADGSWQEVEDFSASFAPDNDPLAFLGGMVDVRELEPLEQSSSFQVSRFAFDLDGPKMAEYLRGRLARYLTEQGELPPGVTIDVPASLRQMEGSGELWVDARGLPLRLTMHLVFPPARDGSQINADVQTRFSGFPLDEPAPRTATGSPLAVGAASLQASAGQVAAHSAAAACSLMIIALLMASRRSRWLYATVMTALILCMIAVPALQSARVAAYYDQQAARSQDIRQLSADGRVLDASAAQDEQEGHRSAAEQLTPPWDPLRDPLADAGESRQAAARSGEDSGDPALFPALGERPEGAPRAIVAVTPSP